jgi:hypothetical protein
MDGLDSANAGWTRAPIGVISGAGINSLTNDSRGEQWMARNCVTAPWGAEVTQVELIRGEVKHRDVDRLASRTQIVAPFLIGGAHANTRRCTEKQAFGGLDAQTAVKRRDCGGSTCQVMDTGPNGLVRINDAGARRVMLRVDIDEATCSSISLIVTWRIRALRPCGAVCV